MKKAMAYGLMFFLIALLML